MAGQQKNRKYKKKTWLVRTTFSDLVAITNIAFINFILTFLVARESSVPCHWVPSYNDRSRRTHLKLTYYTRETVYYYQHYKKIPLKFIYLLKSPNSILHRLVSLRNNNIKIMMWNKAWKIHINTLSLYIYVEWTDLFDFFF